MFAFTKKEHKRLWQIQDLADAGGGRGHQMWRGAQPNILPNFSQKLHETKKIRPQGEGVPGGPTWIRHCKKTMYAKIGD